MHTKSILLDVSSSKKAIAIMDDMSYADMRTLVGTRLQWLADIGENNKGINGRMVKVLDKMNELEDYTKRSRGLKPNG